MFTKLNGHLSLADMISSVIDDSRSKIAAAEGEEKKEKKLLAYEKKEHGHIPSVKEEEQEKKASAAIDFTDPEEIEKLAAALDTVGDELIKEADKVEKGGESPVGGTSLPVMSPVAGKQSNKKDKSVSHNVPVSTGLQAGDGGGPASTQVPNDHAKAPGGAPYPKKGVMKTAAEAVLAKMKEEAAEAEAPEGEEDEVEEPKEEAKPAAKPKAASVIALEAAVDDMAGLNPDGTVKVAEFPPSKDDGKEEKKDDGKKEEGKKAPPFAKKEEGKKEGKDEKEKDASPVAYILNKMAGSLEKKMGGETLDSKSGDGPKPPSNPGREMIASNTAPVAATKAKAKAPQKKMMSQVLTEPMQSKAHDSKVSENLRNAAKGGVKIAAARELLQKIASEGCTCEGKGECKYCKMKKSMEKKSTGMPMGGGSMSSSPMV